jgi:hypothetical protein
MSNFQVLKYGKWGNLNFYCYVQNNIRICEVLRFRAVVLNLLGSLDPQKSKKYSTDP